jgi:hypothetical protein
VQWTEHGKINSVRLASMAMRDYANDQLVDKGHEADWICGPTKDHKTCLVFYFGLIDPKLPNDMEEHEADAYIAGILAEADLAYEGIWGRFVTQGERRARSARWVKKKVPSEVRQFHGKHQRDAWELRKYNVTWSLPPTFIPCDNAATIATTDVGSIESLTIIAALWEQVDAFVTNKNNTTDEGDPIHYLLNNEATLNDTVSVITCSTTELTDFICDQPRDFGTGFEYAIILNEHALKASSARARWAERGKLDSISTGVSASNKETTALRADMKAVRADMLAREAR